jgi:hypothetical protein
MSASAQAQAADQRNAPRSRSLLRGRILFNNDRSALDCIVRNVSDTGARLEVENGHLAPNEFDVFVPQKNRTFHAQLAWRVDENMGVRFVDDSERSEKLREQNRALREENETLRRTVQNLKLRIRHITGDSEAEG